MRLASILLLLLLAVTTALAEPRATRVSILRPEVRSSALPRRASDAAAAADFAQLASRGWRASWDEHGVPRWLYGGTVPVLGASAEPRVAEAAARRFVAEHVALIAPGAIASDWELVANRVDAGLRTVGFRQRWHGLLVDGGQVSCVFGEDRLFVVGSSARPDLAAGDPTARRAEPDFAIAWLKGIVGPLVVGAAGDRVVFDGVLADPIALDGPAARWTLFVALDGRPLAARNALHFDGTLLYDAPVQWPGRARMAYPAQAVAATVDGSAVVSDAGGVLPTTATATVVPSTTGTFAKITNDATPATASLTLPFGGAVTWSAAAMPTDDAELASYVHVMLGKATARRVLPSLGPWLDQQLAVYVNEAGACNAYSTGDDLHFFVGSAACENTGRLGDVVYHELGHSLHNQAVIAGQGAFASDLSEGLADFNATTTTGDSGVARGFDFTDTPLRELDPPGRDLRYPEDATLDPHVPGLIVGGALWDLRTLAGEPVAETALRGLMERAHDLPSAYVAALIADDDDANLGNGTPHGCAIGEAFARHGLAPDVATTTIGVPTVVDRMITVPITRPSNPACPAPAIASATITWRSAAGAGTIAMTSTMTTADGATYAGELPPQPDQTLVDYTVDVALANGMAVRLPSNLADPEYQLFVGTGTVLYCAGMTEDPGWTHTSGWEFGHPPGGSDPPDTGATVFGTNLHASGEYANNAREFAALPTIGTSGFTNVHLQYRRWLTAEDALYDRATIAANGTILWTNAEHFGTLNHLDREWRFHDVDLSSQVANDRVTVSFGLATDSEGTSGGWTLGPVCIVGIGPGCGNGVVDPGEACDGDETCNAACERITYDDGGCCGTSHPSGDLVFGLGAMAWLARPRVPSRRGRAAPARRSRRAARAGRRRS